jgi:beta-1,4-mannosyltransferase
MPLVEIQHLSEPPSLLRAIPFPISAPIKVIWQVVSLLYSLVWYGEEGAEFIMIQVSLK